MTTKTEALAAALELPCPEHDAAAGDYCFIEKSGVRSICFARYLRGTDRVAIARASSDGSAPAPFIDALAEKARAARNVQLHERQRAHQDRTNVRQVKRGMRR